MGLEPGRAGQDQAVALFIRIQPALVPDLDGPGDLPDPAGSAHALAAAAGDDDALAQTGLENRLVAADGHKPSVATQFEAFSVAVGFLGLGERSGRRLRRSEGFGVKALSGAAFGGMDQLR